MSKSKKSQLNQATSTTKSKQLLTPLSPQEQQTIAGAWGRSGGTSSASGWW